MVFALYCLIGRPIGQLTQAVRAAGTYLWTGRTIDPVQARWKLVGLLTVLLCGVVLSQRILLIAAPHREAVHPSLDPRELLAEFEAGPELSIPVGPDDPVLGPADAPAQIVVFSDFQCPACRRHAKNLHALYEKNEAKLQIVFKHYPLNKACNPSLNRDLHPQACEAAYAAEAARRQGKFWPFHDELFVPGVEFDGDTLRSIAESLDLDVQRFETERLDQKTQAKVRSDIALARQLEVRGTPTLFLNKRRLPNINSRAVKILVEKVSSRESR
jgi:protein-disulfide isomerase